MNEKQKQFPRSKVAKPGDYGFCPICGCHGRTRERRLNGNDTCVNGHSYPSAHSRTEPPSTVETKAYNEAVADELPDPEVAADKMRRWWARSKEEKRRFPFGYCPECLHPGLTGARPGGGTFKTHRFRCRYGHHFSYETVLLQEDVDLRQKIRERQASMSLNGLVPPVLPGPHTETTVTRSKTWELTRADVERIIKFHLGIGEDAKALFDYRLLREEEYESVRVTALKETTKEGVDFND